MKICAHVFARDLNKSIKNIQTLQWGIVEHT